jgi:hypothetical protein
LSNHCLMTQTHERTVPSKKTCKCRPFPKRLKGFEPSTFCMAISSSRSQIAPKFLQTADPVGLIPGRVSKNCAEITWV